jgi:hypothetical protein
MIFRVCFEVDSIKNDPYVVLSYSESPFFVGRECDATGDTQALDLPLSFSIKHTGLNCVGGGYNRGGFKYLTVFMPDKDLPTEGGYWHEGHSAPRRESAYKSWYTTLSQKLLGQPLTQNEASKEPAAAFSGLFVNCTAFPSNPNGRAYTGYFDSSSSLLNRIWYAGAYTLQLSTIDPKEGGAIVQFNRFFDHNNAPRGAWYSNYTISNGTVVTTDGAKRDRMVWPGDMTVAVPGIAVSTYDMLAIRNALDTIYEHQYGDGSIPYAGPPMGAFGEFSDTYHLHHLLGTYMYVLYSGDLDWLRSRWDKYVTALEVSLAKVDEFDLMHVTSIFDWNRIPQIGRSVEPSAILLEVLGNSIKLADWISKPTTTRGEAWFTTRERLRRGIASLFCENGGMFSDNDNMRACNGPEKMMPQDGNAWVLMSQAVPSLALNVSRNLRERWTKFGAPAVEFPNVMSPFSSSFELLGHAASGNTDAAVELMELMWGYMLDGPGMTNSTLVEGYRTDGYVQYPAYWSAARNSHAHGWSAGPTTVLTQGILGIKLVTPLGESWEVKPQLGKWLSFARGGFATKLGKFEVSVSLLKSLSTGRKAEGLNITVPDGTSGTVIWGGKSTVRSKDMASSFGYYRFLETDASSKIDEEEWRVWREEDGMELVVDDEWKRPETREWPEGVVDWEALEAGYNMAQQRYDPAAFVGMTKKGSLVGEGRRELRKRG